MINPGYRAKVRKGEFAVLQGKTFYCPKCKKPVARAEADMIYLRCRGCRRWVQFIKKS